MRGLLQGHFRVEQIDKGNQAVFVAVANDAQPFGGLDDGGFGNLDALPGALGQEESLPRLDPNPQIHLPAHRLHLPQGRLGFHRFGRKAVSAEQIQPHHGADGVNCRPNRCNFPN